MRIAKEDVALALQVADRKRRSLMVSFRKDDMEAYQDMLDQLAPSLNLAEGEIMSDEHFSTFLQGYTVMMNSMVSVYAVRSTSLKSKMDPVEFVMAANDYLFAMAMDRLGCPDIGFNNGVTPFQLLLHATSTKIRDLMPVDKFATDEIFNAQRGMAADELNRKLSATLENIQEESFSSRELGQLYAEYQALSKRQQNHTRVWRFFHRSENKARTALLNTMKEALRDHIPDGALEDLDKDPLEIVTFDENSKARHKINEAVFSRHRSPEQAFGYGEYKSNPQTQESLTASVRIEDLLKLNYRPNFDRLADEIELLAAYREAAQNGKIWVENTRQNNMIVELLEQNYLRAITAEKQGVSSAVKEFYQDQEENFLTVYPEFVEPTVIPPLPSGPKVSDNDDLHNQLQMDTSDNLNASNSRIAPPSHVVPQKEIDQQVM